MSEPCLAASDSQPYEMTDAEVEIYFRQRPDVVFPITERMTLEQLLTYWAHQGFDDVSKSFELAIVKEVVSRLEQLDPHHAMRVLGERGELLARFDLSCKDDESVRLLKDYATQTLYPHSSPHARYGLHPETGPSMIGGPCVVSY